MKSSNPFVQLLIDAGVCGLPPRKKQERIAKLKALGDPKRNTNKAEAAAARKKARILEAKIQAVPTAD